MRTHQARCPLILVFALTLFSPATKAEEQQDKPASPKSGLERFLERDYMFGDWGGKRSALSKKGIDFEFFYFGAMPVNISGGIKQGSVLEGALLTTLDLDSEKLVGYQGGHFHAGAVWLHSGDRFSQNYVGDLNVVSLIDFPDGLRLWELWYEQKFWKNKVSLKFGQLAIDRDFIVPEYYNSMASINFLNQTFFYPTLAFNVYDIKGLPRGDHALASTPYGAPGVRLRVDPIEHWYFQAGVYDGKPDLSDSGTRINLNDKEGALAYFEAGYRLNDSKDSSGLPGSYKVGGYLHTDDFQDVHEAAAAAFGLTSAQPRMHPNNYGVYLLAEQMIYREQQKDDPAQQGLMAFFRTAAAPADRNLVSLGVDGGVVYKGLIRGRDWDTLGIAGSYLKVSPDISRAYRDAALLKPDYEGVIETSYKAQITAWWTLQPSLQYVIHPGGRLDIAHQSISDAFVFILQTTLRF